MAKLKRYILPILVVLIILFSWYLVAYDIVPPIIWSWQNFTNPDYYSQLKTEWDTKSSNFLLRKLHSIDIMRFSTAANILVKRKEQRAVPVLIKKAKSHYVDEGIHFSACGALALISPKDAKKVLMDVIEIYKNVRNQNSSYYRRYDNALLILAKMKDERVYPICLGMAKSGNRQEQESSLNGMLYYFNNHAEEILPLYLDYLNIRKSPKGQTIKAIKNLKRPEVIPVLEGFALKNKDYAKDAREAVEYLKTLQK